MARDLTCRVDQFRIEFVKFIVQILNHLTCRIQCVFTIFHGRSAGMIGLPHKGKLVIDHTANALYNAYILFFRFQNGPLFDVQLQQRGTFIGRNTVAFIADPAACGKRLPKSFTRGMGARSEHFFLFELTAYDARTHHCRLVIGPLSVRAVTLPPRSVS